MSTEFTLTGHCSHVVGRLFEKHVASPLPQEPVAENFGSEPLEQRCLRYMQRAQRTQRCSKHERVLGIHDQANHIHFIETSSQSRDLLFSLGLTKFLWAIDGCWTVFLLESRHTGFLTSNISGGSSTIFCRRSLIRGISRVLVGSGTETWKPYERMHSNAEMGRGTFDRWG